MQVGSNYVTIESSKKSFKTQASTQTNDLGYLNCYEVPEIASSGNLVSGFEAEGRGYMWYRYGISGNSNRAVATHTYIYNNQRVRNYTVLLDGNKKTPVWTAHAMHASMWPDKNAGRNDGWTDDPAFTGLGSWQQSGVSNYSKGHLVASDYRQTSVPQNKQTFYYSNQAPQDQSFNGGIWVQLENKVKSAAPTGRDTLYVVTGVLYEGTPVYDGGIQIPSHFYKCLVECSFNTSGEMTSAKGCAYLFTNEPKDNNTANALPNYQTTIKEIENRTGFTFFPKVTLLNKNTATSLW